MKNLSTLFYFFISINVYGQKNVTTSTTTKALENHILLIVKAFQQKDTTILNSYIDTTVGCYQLPPYGTIQYPIVINKIDLTSYTYNSSLFGEFNNKKKRLKFEELPEYNCDKGKWNKKGLFANRSKFISLILENLLRIEYDEHYTIKDVEKMRIIEKNSYWVIYAPNDDTAISFQITYWKGNYIITAIENAPLYCDI